MNPTPNLCRPADDLLVLLSQRLLRPISRRLQSVFEGHYAAKIKKDLGAIASGNFTDLLHLEEMDKLLKKKHIHSYAQYKPYKFSATDPYYQLKFLTDQLESAPPTGYFRSLNPAIPQYSQQLVLMRNQLCHYEELSSSEILRCYDSAARLLFALGDSEGNQEVVKLFKQHASALGLVRSSDYKRPELDREVKESIRKTESAPLIEVQDTTEVTEENTDGFDTPVEFDLSNLPSSEGRRTIARHVYSPWIIEPLGERSQLENLHVRANAAAVRNAIIEIVGAEAPISLDRLIRLTGYAFGFAKVGSVLMPRIKRQVAKAGETYIDEYKFVWPSFEDYENFSSYRTDPEGYQRSPKEISPHELANIYRYVRGLDEMPENENRAVLKIMDRRRMTEPVRHQLALAREVLAAEDENV